jgi:hypothetical protein
MQPRGTPPPAGASLVMQNLFSHIDPVLSSIAAVAAPFNQIPCKSPKPKTSQGNIQVLVSSLVADKELLAD